MSNHLSRGHYTQGRDLYPYRISQEQVNQSNNKPMTQLGEFITLASGICLMLFTFLWLTPGITANSSTVESKKTPNTAPKILIEEHPDSLDHLLEQLIAKQGQ